MPSGTTHRIAALIERDRRRVEIPAIRAAHRVGRAVRTLAFAAARLGQDPGPGIAAAILGDPGIGQRGIVGILAESMTLAHLEGLRRAGIAAGAAPVALRLSREDDDRARRRRREQLALLLLLTLDELDALDRRYEAAASIEAARLATYVTGKVRQAAAAGGGALSPATVAGWGTGLSPAGVRAALTAAGISADPAQDFALAGLATTQILRGYGDGQSRGYAGLGTRVRGLEHVSVLDEGTTPICRACDRTRLPVDHPYWLSHTPPLHWGCRSVLVPILGAFAWSAVPAVSAAPGFGASWRLN